MFKAKVLVVDDEQQVRELIILRLGRFSYDVFSADSGQKALDILQCNPIDVVVSDLRMPGIDGFELIAKAVEMDSTMQGIIITGCLDEHMEKQASSLGNVVIFEKPLDFSTLNNAIEEALTRRKAPKITEVFS